MWGWNLSGREGWANHIHLKFIWNNSYLYCGCRWKWRVIIAVNFQFKQLERRSLKKSRLQRDSNPWPPRYWCDALPTELWSHTLGGRSTYWVHIFLCSEMMFKLLLSNCLNCKIYCDDHSSLSYSFMSKILLFKRVLKPIFTAFSCLNIVLCFKNYTVFVPLWKKITHV